MQKKKFMIYRRDARKGSSAYSPKPHSAPHFEGHYVEGMEELAILNYYTKAKGLSIATAIEYINEESPTGTKVIAKYNELMRIGDILSNERKILREMIIEDLVHRYANLADTSEILKPVTSDVGDCEQYKQAKLFVELDSSLIWCKEKAKEAKDIIATMK